MKIDFDTAATPDEIERRSFEIIDSEVGLPRKYAGHLWEVARRCIHAAGDVSIIDDLELEERGLERGLQALANSCKIFTDTRMLAAGLVPRRMDALGVQVIPLMAIDGLSEKARETHTTRCRAGIKQIAPQLAGNIVAIGNAPTALIGLLEELEEIEDPMLGPALIVGMPVGFVNAAQSKQWLLQSVWPKFTLTGRRGGSALAAAAINALANIALAKGHS